MLASMKRSISQLDNSSDGLIPKGSLKRAVSESHVAGNTRLENDDGGDKETSNLLVRTNREMRLELERRKRKIDELCCEVETCRKRSDEIEQLITIIDRAWIQLEKEVNSIAATLGSEASTTLSTDWTRLLQCYIEVNSQTVSPSSEYALDDWATKGDIERAREIALDNNTSLSTDTLPSQLSNRIDCVTQALRAIYSRLCSLSPDGASSVLPAVMSHTPSSLTQPYEDSILQLNAQIIALKADLNHNKRELHHVYRQLDLAKEMSSASSEVLSTDAAIPPISAAQPTAPSPTTDDIDAASPDQTALISRLRSELHASEELRRKLEEGVNMQLLAPPNNVAKEAPFSEQLQLASSKITELINERTMLNAKLSQISAAQDQLLQDTQQRIESVIGQTEEKIQRTIQEKNELKKKYDEAQCDIRMISSYKAQAASYDALEASLKQEVARLSAHLSTQTAKCNDCEAKLIASRQREVQLEARLAAVMDSSANEEEGQVYEVTPQQIQTTMSQAHAKIKEYEAEIADYKTNVNDLILEIETIVKNLEVSKDVQKKLNEQIATEQRLQRTLIEDNIKLQNELTSKGNQVELEQKLERLTSLMKQQDQVIVQLKTAEHHYRSEVINQQNSNVELRATNEMLQQLVQETKSKCSDLEFAQENSKKLISDLRQRCEQLRVQYEEERKSRLEYCSNMNNSKPEKSQHPSLNDEDSQMLDMTLSMLRCSVCKDRFKQAVITRCYHMFCKECIDENLKSRHRKCPACGEKFGQDDVRVVYFTH